MTRWYLGLAALACSALLLTGTVGCGSKTATQDPTTGKKLTLTKPSNQTLTRGAATTNGVDIKIGRDNFTDPVTIKLDLPKGVEVTEKDMTIPTGDKSRTFNLKANADATPGDHNATVTATAPGGLSASETFTIKINEK